MPGWPLPAWPRSRPLPLFPTMRHGQLTGREPLPPANVHMMIQRRAIAAGIETRISCHSFRATGITTYLQNGGKLEVAQQALRVNQWLILMAPSAGLISIFPLGAADTPRAFSRRTMYFPGLALRSTLK